MQEFAMQKATEIVVLVTSPRLLDTHITNYKLYFKASLLHISQSCY